MKRKKRDVHLNVSILKIYFKILLAYTLQMPIMSVYTYNISIWNGIWTDNQVPLPQLKIFKIIWAGTLALQGLFIFNFPGLVRLATVFFA